MNFWTNVKLLMDFYGLTTDDLAEYLNKDANLIQSWMDQNTLIDFITANKIADFLAAKLEDLIEK